MKYVFKKSSRRLHQDRCLLDIYVYSKTLGSSWQYYRDEPVLDNNKNIIDFSANNKNNNSISFKFKQKITGLRGNDGTKVAEIMVPFKDLSIFWRVLEMPLINSEINIQLVWSNIVS